MNINEAFPSKFLKCADLQGRKAKVVIDHVEMDKIGDDTKLIVYFRGKDKGLVLNKTNASVISDMHGDDTDDWSGCDIMLFPTRVDYQGKRVDAIRVEFVQPPPRGQKIDKQAAKDEQQMRKPAAAAYDDRNPPPRETVDDMNDSIDF